MIDLVDLVDVAAGAVVPEALARFKSMETLVNLLIIAGSKGRQVWSSAKLSNEIKRYNYDLAKGRKLFVAA